MDEQQPKTPAMQLLVLAVGLAGLLFLLLPRGGAVIPLTGTVTLPDGLTVGYPEGWSTSTTELGAAQFSDDEAGIQVSVLPMAAGLLGEGTTTLDGLTLFLPTVPVPDGGSFSQPEETRIGAYAAARADATGTERDAAAFMVDVDGQFVFVTAEVPSGELEETMRTIVSIVESIGRDTVSGE